MKIQNLISKVLFKAAPMLPTEHNELEQNMNLWFDKQKQKVAAKLLHNKSCEADPSLVPEPLTLIDKFFGFLDEWYIRALFAMSYVFLIRWVQDFMNPAEPDEHPDDILDRR